METTQTTKAKTMTSRGYCKACDTVFCFEYIAGSDRAEFAAKGPRVWVTRPCPKCGGHLTVSSRSNKAPQAAWTPRATAADCADRYIVKSESARDAMLAHGFRVTRSATGRDGVTRYEMSK